jgi:Family of unknown function (DUF6516)
LTPHHHVSPLIDYELEFLLGFDGYSYKLETGHIVRFRVKECKVTNNRPHGLRYSLTVHTPSGHRVYGIDNAHKIKHSKTFDHYHKLNSKKIVRYEYVSPLKLFADFCDVIIQILKMYGVSQQ